MCFSGFYEPLHNLFHVNDVNGRRGVSQSYGGPDVHLREPLETPQPCFHFPTTIIYQLEMPNLKGNKFWIRPKSTVLIIKKKPKQPKTSPN